MTQDDPWNKVVSAYMNPEFICIKSRSGRGGLSIGSGVDWFLLACDVDDRELGDTLIAGLERSRQLTNEELRERVAAAGAEYKAWIAVIMQQFKYRSRRAMFKNMKNCDVVLKEGLVEIRPSKHEKLEGWGRTEGDGIEDISVPKDATPAELGAALRLGFDRCR